MDLLKTWLEKKAGLSGPRLTAAIKACQIGMVYSVEDLLEVYDMNGLKELFPMTMIYLKVKTVLEQEKHNSEAQDTTTNAKESPTVSNSSAAIRQADQQTQPQSTATKNTDQASLRLPPGKLYYFFASHKVRSAFDLCVLAYLYVICLLYLLFRNYTLYTARIRKLLPEQPRIGWKMCADYVAFSM
jgi:hypothetical protein